MLKMSDVESFPLPFSFPLNFQKKNFSIRLQKLDHLSPKMCTSVNCIQRSIILKMPPLPGRSTRMISANACLSWSAGITKEMRCEDVRRSQMSEDEKTNQK